MITPMKRLRQAGEALLATIAALWLCAMASALMYPLFDALSQVHMPTIRVEIVRGSTP